MSVVFSSKNGMLEASGTLRDLADALVHLLGTAREGAGRTARQAMLEADAIAWEIRKQVHDGGHSTGGPRISP